MSSEKGSDLRCADCGALAADVSPNFNLGPGDGLNSALVNQMRTFWTCTNGHKNTHVWTKGAK